MSKVIIAISGGVDSAVAAKILKDQGHDVTGVFMRNWDAAVNNDKLGNPTRKNAICPQELDWNDVQRIGQQLKISIDRVDFVKEYWDEVFSDLISNYKQGLTPNPDILCNRYIKFGRFYDYVFSRYPNTDFIATGHYASIENGVLKQPKDKNKDQTYFLAQIRRGALKRTLFPLASITKPLVRKIALASGLVIANKRESMGICFIGKRDFARFLQNYIPARPGAIVDIRTHKQVGSHNGIMYYTVGQRKGLHLGGMAEPFYVAGHDLKKCTIYVAPQSDKSYLQSDQAFLTKVNWLVAKKVGFKNLRVRFRYRTKAVACSIEWTDDHELMVFYPDGFEAVAPGQQAVFYSDNSCLGGGVITNVYKNGDIKKYL